MYLHVLDAVETATARGLLDDAWPPRRSTSATTLATVLDRWRTIARATAGISDPGWSSLTSVRHVTGPIVADKLDFVHGCVTGHHGRLAFYKTDSRSSP